MTGTIKPNGDIEYSHGYTSRKEGETTSSSSSSYYQPTYQQSPQVPIMVEATVVVPQAQPVVPEGIPVTTSESSSSGKRTIAEMAKICESELGVSGNVMSVINQAAEQLNVKTGDRPLVEVAEECMRVMGY